MKTYKETKAEILAIIKKVKLQSIILGEYLERSIIFDDKSETFSYLGDNDLELIIK